MVRGIQRGGVMGLSSCRRCLSVKRPQAFCDGRGLWNDGKRVVASKECNCVFGGVFSFQGIGCVETLADFKDSGKQASLEYHVG